MGSINPGAGFIISSSTALLTSIAILITNEYISEMEIRFSKLREWINLITLLNEKILKQSMVDKKIDVGEVEDLKEVQNHYPAKKRKL